MGCPEELFLEECDFKDMRVKEIPDLTPHALYCTKQTNYGKPKESIRKEKGFFYFYDCFCRGNKANEAESKISLLVVITTPQNEKLEVSAWRHLNAKE